MSTARKPLPDRDGRPVYRYAEVPDGLMHQTGLAEIGRKPAEGQQPLGYLRYRGNRSAPLFAVADAATKKVISDEHRAKLCVAAAARFACPRCGGDCRDSPTPPWAAGDFCGSCSHRELEAKMETDRTEAITWAKGMLSRSRCDVAIGDTETAWLHGPVCELALTDVEGNVIFHSVVNPLVKIDPEAQAIHGISNEEARRAPTLRELFDQVSAAIAGRHVLFWNSEYDEDVLRHEAYRAHGLPWEAHAKWATAAGGSVLRRYNDAQHWMDTWTRECLMQWHAQGFGAFDTERWEYRWGRLGGNHRALGDCHAAVDRLIELAGIPRSEQLALPIDHARPR